MTSESGLKEPSQYKNRTDCISLGKNVDFRFERCTGAAKLAYRPRSGSDFGGDAPDSELFDLVAMWPMLSTDVRRRIVDLARTDAQ